MTPLRTRLSLALTTLGMASALYLAPATAEAGEVMCSNDFGSCTVSNDGFDLIFCDCEGGFGSEDTGGDFLEGLSDEELLLECEAALETCSEFGTGTGGSEDGFETFGEEGFETGEADTGFETFGEESSETGEGGLDTTGGEDGESGTGDTADAGNDSSADEGDADSGGEDGGATGGDDGAGESGTDDGDEGPGGTDEAADGGETAGESDGGQDLDEAGCSCSTEDAGAMRNAGLAFVLLLGAFGLRRRR